MDQDIIDYILQCIRLALLFAILLIVTGDTDSSNKISRTVAACLILIISYFIIKVTDLVIYLSIFFAYITLQIRESFD